MKEKVTVAVISVILAGLVLFGLYFYLTHRALVSKALEKPFERLMGPDKYRSADIEKLSRSIELAPHLVTIRWRISAYSCKEKKYDRIGWIDIPNMDILKIQGEARMCWAAEADVAAGFRTQELFPEPDGKGGFVINAHEPRMLGVDNRSIKLIYSKEPEKFDWKEKDIFPELNATLEQEAKKLGILDDAKKSLEHFADRMSVKYDIPISVKYITIN